MPPHSVTLLTVDTAYHELTNHAIERTLQQFKVSDVLVFTDLPQKFPGIPTRSIKTLTSKDEYNQLILTEAVNYLDSDFGLVIQYDGFALDGSRWESNFLDYDYIGAPWPNLGEYNIGNGGFSLRSKKLMENVARFAHNRNDNEPEDYFIGVTLRSLLEKTCNAKFPTDTVALRFSFESPGHPKQSFGFHGILNLAIAYQNNPWDFFLRAPSDLIQTRGRELAYGITQLPFEAQEIFTRTWSEWHAARTS